MAMFRTALLVSAATFGFISAALSADLPPPPPMEQLPLPAPIEASGWYLRGDVGFGISSQPTGVAIAPDPLALGIGSGYLSTGATNTFNNSSLSGSGFFDFGVGYQFNPWLRGDITGELRGGSHFQSLEVINDPAFPGTGKPAQFADFYRGDISTYLLMANVYADLGTWSGITPYVGAGIGYGTTQMSGLTDQGTALGGPVGGYFGNGSQSGFAWALMTGLDFHVTQNLTMELGYRYLSYEGFKSGGSNCLNGGGINGGFNAANCGGIANVLSSARLASNDFLLGFRWTIGDVTPPPAPLVRRY